MIGSRSSLTSSALALALVAMPIGALAAPATVSGGVVLRIDANGDALWRAELGALESTGEPAVLAAGPWLPPLPVLEIPLIGGGAFRTAEADGDVLLLDFWATWCEPCLEELPRLQQLQDEWRDRGLRIVTVNSGEPPAIALDFLDALGVELPAGLYSDEVREAVPVSSLPTLLLVDREGRMVQRWSGYAEELVDEVADRIAGLLDPATARRDVLARADGGSLRLEVAWARRVAGAAGLAVLPPTGDEGRDRPLIAVGTDGGVVLLDGEGEIVRRASEDAAAGALVRAPRGLGGSMVGFRPGGRRVVRFDEALLGEGADVPSFVLDAALGPDPGGAPSLWAATIDGLLRRTADGWTVDGEPGEVRALAATGGALVALRAPATLERRGGSGAPRVAVALDEAWRLEAAPGDTVLVADGTVLDLELVTHTGEAGAAVAAITIDGRLELVALEDGSVLHRSRWEDPLAALAAGDLDGDGTDELVLAAGPRVVVLRRAR